MDSYLSSIKRIAAKDYIPSDKDVLHSRVKTTGITETTFVIEDLSNSGPMNWKVYDCGGTRSERKIWIHCFENAQVILFTVDMGCYDQLLYEDEAVNRMQEAITLFDSIVNSRWFVKTQVVLCFTKQAKMAAKLKKSPIVQYWPAADVITDPLDVTMVTDFIVEHFMNLNKNPAKTVHTLVMPEFPREEDWRAIERVTRNAHKNMP